MEKVRNHIRIDGGTKLIVFLGSSYKSSKMYRMYNAVFRTMELNYLYVPAPVGDLEKAVDGIRNLGIAAAGITIPYKIDIMQYLDELDDTAQRIRAVNYLLNHNGKLIGGNTDGEGAVMALREEVEIAGCKVVIIGAGGAARAVAYAVSGAGGKVTILNRNLDKAAELAGTVRCQHGGLGIMAEAMTGADILINCTSVGMAGTDSENLSIVPADLLKSKMVVMDLVIYPQVTPLIRNARMKNCRIVQAHKMLLWQGILKFKKYTGVEPDIETMIRAMETD